MVELKVLGTPLVLVTTKDPWYKKGHYLRRPPPWSKSRQHWSAILARPAMAKAVAAFSAVAHLTAGIDRWQRREIMAKVLKVGRGGYGGKVREKKPKVPSSEVNARVSRGTEIVNRIKAAPSASAAIDIATEIIRGG